MSPRDTARALAAGRIAFGVALILAPRASAASWLGRDAARPAATVMARAVGIRDLAMGAIVLHTVDHPEIGPRWVATCALADAVDGAAGLAARRDLPRARGAAFVAVAASAAAAGATAARALRRPAAP